METVVLDASFKIGKEVEILINQCYTCTEKGKYHQENQDTMLCMSVSVMNDVATDIFLVADGMSNTENGNAGKIAKLCKEKFMGSFFENIIGNYDVSDKDFSIINYRDRLQQTLMQSLFQSNMAVSTSELIEVNGGTTLSVLLIVKDFAVGVNVGDSPIYYYNSKDEEFTVLSDVQNLGEQNYQRGVYLRCSEQYRKDRNYLTNYIGKYENLEEEEVGLFSVEKMHEGDMFLICTDGVIDYDNKAEILEILLNEVLSSEEKIKILIEKSRRKNNDDKTAILICCGEM